MINPVELINRSRRRLMRLAAGQVAATWLLPIGFTIALALSLQRIRSLILDRYDYMIAPGAAVTLHQAILLVATLELAALGWFAFRAWRQNDDFDATAQRIDDAVGGRQEIVTLATFADPAHPERSARRSPLFAMLWRRAIAHMESFNPRREFGFEAGRPLGRSAILSGAVAVLIGLAMIALMRAPSAIEAATYRLRQFADKLDAPGATAADHQMAEAIRDVAQDLATPRLPPQQKLAELQAIKQAIAKVDQPKSVAQAGSGNSGGNGNGAGNGNGSGGTGKGEGKGQDKGAGSDARGQGNGSGGANKGGPGDKQTLELHNDIAKAEAKLEAESGADNQSQVARNPGQNGSGMVPQPGSNPNQNGPQSRPNGTGNIQMPGGGKLADNQTPPASNGSTPRDDGKGSQGDTHLGDFPKAANYERYYRLGDKGPPIDIKDARYVTFRLPTSIVAGGEVTGKVVHDAGSPAAKTPYINAPLKEQRIAASPDEEQLLPPRYKDLIR
jgi:hypothetical protein